MANASQVEIPLEYINEKKKSYSGVNTTLMRLLDPYNGAVHEVRRFIIPRLRI
jgi:hypothetical protein